MKRLSFFKKFLAFFCVAAAIVALFSFAVWRNGRAYARVSFATTYYLLVQTCEEETAVSVSAQAYFSGGAGYLITVSGKECVALAGYKRERDASFVEGTLRQKGVETEIVSCACRDFVLNGGAAAQKESIVGNLETVDSNVWLLYDVANGLERTTLSQEEARAAVKGVLRSLGGLRTGNASEPFARWNAALYSAERKAREIANGIVFAKDVRYLQVQLIAMLYSADRLFA